MANGTMRHNIKQQPNSKRGKNDEVFLCPRYVVRTIGGWQVRLPKHKTVWFADSNYGGPKGSHEQACHNRYAAMPKEIEDFIGFHSIERADKKRPLGIPGASLEHKRARGGRSAQVEIVVRAKGQPSRSIYVGTPQNFESRLAEKLILAERARQNQISAAILKKARV